MSAMDDWKKLATAQRDALHAAIAGNPTPGWKFSHGPLGIENSPAGDQVRDEHYVPDIGSSRAAAAAIQARRADVERLSARELLVRAKTANDLTYTADPDQVAAGHRELETLREEAERRVPRGVEDPGLDGELATYVSMLGQNLGGTYDETEFDDLHEAVHRGLDLDPDGDYDRAQDDMAEQDMSEEDMAENDELVDAAGEPRDPDEYVAALQDDRDRCAARGDFERADALNAQVQDLRHPVLDIPAQRSQDLSPTLADVDREAAQDRADRADPDLAKLADARDHQAAGGRFTLADASQRLIDASRQREAADDRGDRVLGRSLVLQRGQVLDEGRQR